MTCKHFISMLSKQLFGLLFLGVFVEKYTITIWYMWNKKLIEKYIYKNVKNFMWNPNKVVHGWSLPKAWNVKE
mgnify:CR=1 FL=1